MLTAYDLNDSRCRRTLSYLPRFREANAPRPQAEDWRDWEALLLSRESAAGSNEAMRIVTDAGFGTVSSSLIALPARNLDQKSIWRFASRYPQAEPYHTINV